MSNSVLDLSKELAGRRALVPGAPVVSVPPLPNASSTRVRLLQSQPATATNKPPRMPSSSPATSSLQKAARKLWTRL